MEEPRSKSSCSAGSVQRVDLLRQTLQQDGVQGQFEARTPGEFSDQEGRVIQGTELLDGDRTSLRVTMFVSNDCSNENNILGVPN